MTSQLCTHVKGFTHMIFELEREKGEYIDSIYYPQAKLSFYKDKNIWLYNELDYNKEANIVLQCNYYKPSEGRYEIDEPANHLIFDIPYHKVLIQCFKSKNKIIRIDHIIDAEGNCEFVIKN